MALTVALVMIGVNGLGLEASLKLPLRRINSVETSTLFRSSSTEPMKKTTALPRHTSVSFDRSILQTQKEYEKGNEVMSPRPIRSPKLSVVTTLEEAAANEPRPNNTYENFMNNIKKVTAGSKKKFSDTSLPQRWKLSSLEDQYDDKAKKLLEDYNDKIKHGKSPRDAELAYEVLLEKLFQEYKKDSDALVEKIKQELTDQKKKKAEQKQADERQVRINQLAQKLTLLLQKPQSIKNDFEPVLGMAEKLEGLTSQERNAYQEVYLTQRMYEEAVSLKRQYDNETSEKEKALFEIDTESIVNEARKKHDAAVKNPWYIINKQLDDAVTAGKNAEIALLTAIMNHKKKFSEKSLNTLIKALDKVRGKNEERYSAFKNREMYRRDHDGYQKPKGAYTDLVRKAVLGGLYEVGLKKHETLYPKTQVEATAEQLIVEMPQEMKRRQDVLNRKSVKDFIDSQDEVVDIGTSRSSLDQQHTTIKKLLGNSESYEDIDIGGAQPLDVSVDPQQKKGQEDEPATVPAKGQKKLTTWTDDLITGAEALSSKQPAPTATLLPSAGGILPDAVTPGGKNPLDEATVSESEAKSVVVKDNVAAGPDPQKTLDLNNEPIPPLEQKNASRTPDISKLDHRSQAIGMGPRESQKKPGRQFERALHEYGAAQNEKKNRPLSNKEQEKMIQELKTNFEILSINSRGFSNLKTEDARKKFLVDYEVAKESYKKALNERNEVVKTQEMKEAQQAYEKQLNELEAKKQENTAEARSLRINFDRAKKEIQDRFNKEGKDYDDFFRKCEALLDEEIKKAEKKDMQQQNALAQEKDKKKITERRKQQKEEVNKRLLAGPPTPPLVYKEEDVQSVVPLHERVTNFVRKNPKTVIAGAAVLAGIGIGIAGATGAFTSDESEADNNGDNDPARKTQ